MVIRPSLSLRGAKATWQSVIPNKGVIDIQYYVYILSNRTGTSIYVGVTRDLIRRVYEHKHHLDKGSFTDKYDVTRLVYFESTSDVRVAIEREKQIKGWNRARKNKLVATMNPQWDDLYESILL